MTITKSYIETIFKTLPISYYLKRNCKASLNDDIETSYYNISTDEILISTKQLFRTLQTYNKKKDVSNEEAESVIRSILYHEVSHALLTPDRDRWYKQLNVFEDERIETALKDYYLNVDFKKTVFLVNDFNPNRKPRNEWETFYYLVRFRIGKPEYLKRVKHIINRYSNMNKYSSRDRVDMYEYYVNELYKDVCNEYKKDTQLEKIKKQEELNKKQISQNNINNNKTQNSKPDDNPDTQDDTSNTQENKENTQQDNNNVDTKQEENLTKTQNEENNQGNSNTKDNTVSDTSTKDEKKKDKLQDALDNAKKEQCSNEQETDKEIIRNATYARDRLINQWSNKKIYQDLSMIINQNRKLANASNSAINAYSGEIDTRSCGRDDYKFFTHQNRKGNLSKYSKLKLNLFIDCSGSFSSNVGIVNTILYNLGKIEDDNKNFKFDVIKMKENMTIAKKDDIFIEASGCNDVSPKAIDIMRQVQDKDAKNVNLVLFDGFCFSSVCFMVSSLYTRYPERIKNLEAFNRKDVIMISDNENEEIFNRHLKNAKVIITKNYVKELYNYILMTLKTYLR